VVKRLETSHRKNDLVDEDERWILTAGVAPQKLRPDNP
jgi:hypothetical protein